MNVYYQLNLARRYAAGVAGKVWHWMAAQVKISGDAGRDCAPLSESGFSGLAGFTGFHFARLAVFAIIGNPPKANTDERLPIKDEPAES